FVGLLSLIPPPPSLTLFPYTTLFRSNARLADAIDLQTQTKQAHWNVKGPHFIALHELFDKVNADVEDYVDLIAERAVQLGGTARSEEHTSELQSRGHLVCRLLLEKKN